MRAVAPKGKRAVHSVESAYVAAVCCAMVACTDWAAAGAGAAGGLQARTNPNKLHAFDARHRCLDP